MTSRPQKTAIASAISLAVGTLASAPALADTLTQIQINDIGSTLNGVGGGGSGTYSTALDGNSGGFRFGNINPTTYNNVNGWTGDVGPLLAQQNANSTGSFSTGFMFSSTPFVPFTFGSGFAGDINVDNAGNLTLDIQQLDFGGNFQTGGPGVDFLLPPDAGTLNVNWVENGSVADEKLVSFQWEHLITTAEDSTGNFSGFNARWIIEGAATVTDGPPLIFIRDAGGTPNPDSEDISQNIPVNSTYTDQGAVCQDVVDGDISASVTTTPADLTNVDTSAPGFFTVVYDCQDSATNAAASVTRTVTIVGGVDNTAPDLTLLSPTDPEAGRNDPDPMTVNLLQGKTYVDAGATCVDDFDGDITGSIVTTGTVDETVPGAYPIDFDCSDAAGNAAMETRTVNVIADDEAPTVDLTGADPFTLAVGAVWNDPGATCTDTNPVDADPTDISDRVDINPTSIDSGSEATFTVTYDCTDLAGNAAAQETRTVNVVAGQNFRILSMTISDLAPQDGLAGCFKFNNLNPTTCAGANLFSSDDSGSPGAVGTGSERIRGVGTDQDADGNPIGIEFDKFQPITEFIIPPPDSILTDAGRLPVSRIAPGFLFARFPFVPVTFDPSTEPGSNNPEVATVPEGFVTVSGSTALLTMDSIPFGGLYESNAPNLFFLDPDEGTFTGTITEINNDDDGTTRTFNYFMTWNHLITETEDPTGQFVNFDAFWRMEGVLTAESTPFVINNPPVVNSMSASQDGRDPTTIVVVDNGGSVTVTASATDPDNDGLNYDWSQNNVTPVGPTDQSTFTFDPAGLSEGALGLVVVVTDDNAEPLSTAGEIVLMVEQTAPALSDSEDSDGDGTSDADEGFGDNDGDSIPNYQDPIDGATDPGRNRVDFRDPSGGDIVASAGRVRLGRVSAATGEGDFIATEEDIAQYGGPGATPTDNSRDRLNDVGSVGPVPGGIRDFIVDGLTPGESVQIVIPQHQPLPAEPEIRKYTSATGWIPFNRTSGNAWGSAPKVGGVCPPPGDPAYASPTDTQGSTIMLPGDECVQLTIVDGGANDADRTRNGIIRDPSTASSNGPASSASSSSGGCTLANSTSHTKRGDWWLVLTGLLGLLGYNRSRRAAVSTKSKH